MTRNIPTECAKCPQNGRYCAPKRCYCGHDTCPAFASWKPRPKPAGDVPAGRTAQSWAERKESTWLDN